MKLVLPICIILLSTIPNLIFGQKSDAYNELKSSFAYGKTAKDNANTSLDDLKKCYQQSSIDDFQYYVRKTISGIEDAIMKTGYAEDDASIAEIAAGNTNCNDAENKANSAAEDFNTAKSGFDNAAAYLKRVVASDNKDDIEFNLKKAKDAIEEGIIDLNNAFINLNDAVTELKTCN